MPVIQLKYCRIAYTKDGATTFFPDGTSVDAIPHPDMPHYIRVAADCGYDGDTLAYCREHEAAHSLIAEWLCDAPSQVLWALAHNEKLPKSVVIYEEIAAQALQRWLRKNERPIVSGVRWDDLRDYALAKLAEAERPNELERAA